MYAFSGKEGRPDDQVDTLAYAVLAIDRLGLAGGSIDADELPFAIGERNRFYENRRY